MSISKISKRLLILISLLCLSVMPMMAQDADAGYQEALQRIEAARANGATGLDLSGLSLTTVPPEISQLKIIETVSLNNSRLISDGRLVS